MRSKDEIMQMMYFMLKQLETKKPDFKVRILHVFKNVLIVL